MAENSQRLRKLDIIGPEGTVIASGVLISPNAEDVTVKNQVGQSTEVSANLKDFLFKKFSSATESDDGEIIEIRTAEDDYFSIDPSQISILQSWSDYQNLNKKRLVGLYDSEGNYIADFLSGIETLDPTLAQFETTDIDENIDAVIGLYDLEEYTPVTIKDEEIEEGTPVSAEDQAKELMASLGNSSFWQRLIERERADKDRLIGIYDEAGVLKGHFEPTKENLAAIVDLYNKGILCYENNITAADGTQGSQKVYKGTVTSLEDAYDLVIDLKKKSIYQHLIELKDFWIVLPFECYDNVEEAGHSIANKYDIDGLSWTPTPTTEYLLDFSLSVDGSLAVAKNVSTRQNIILPSAINGRPVTSIAPEVFKNDSSLEGVWNSTLWNYQPIQIDEIGKQAFFECTALTQIRLNNVKKIGLQAFSGCTSLSSISLDNIEIIKSSAFSGCTSLTSVMIGSGLTSIGDAAFHDCEWLTSITIPFVGATKDGIDNTHFGYIFGAFSYANNKDFVPESLKEVIITGDTSIGRYAFYSCDNIWSVTIGNDVTSIGSEAFRYCSGLTSVTIGNGVTSIDSYAFHSCSNLTSVTIGSGVTRISDLAFWKIGNEATITLLGTTPPTISNETFYSDYIKKIIVPKGCKGKYIEITNWANLAEKIEEAAE